ncbi:hypothetical protein ORI20_31070 [Mycobacterium sp. CVI_P3]|uniref:Uncharacterized protein n=1 Tax=Mycobacterium pinniadriaticum TaxID=2994102 RepID=A0ABT3SNL9_9MYCO|nr:hypothetical protein [Mycobacterium pinniadriaticum]MCX2934716.1 hypothetical protein [Mycobacterium pinniadriaticum]MCX2941132.1 hypothetical protein [Mycobacterium pinniadriaticum]
MEHAGSSLGKPYNGAGHDDRGVVCGNQPTEPVTAGTVEGAWQRRNRVCREDEHLAGSEAPLCRFPSDSVVEDPIMHSEDDVPIIVEILYRRWSPS